MPHGTAQQKAHARKGPLRITGERLADHVTGATEGMSENVSRSMAGARRVAGAVGGALAGAATAALRTWQKTTLSDVIGPRRPPAEAPPAGPRRISPPDREGVGRLTPAEQRFIANRARDIALSKPVGEQMDAFEQSMLLLDVGYEAIEGDLTPEQRLGWDYLIERYLSHPRVREEILERRRIRSQTTM